MIIVKEIVVHALVAFQSLKRLQWKTNMKVTESNGSYSKQSYVLVPFSA